MAAKVGMLEEHLKFIGKTSDRRKCSRSALAEANVDKRLAGKKGSTNKYRYCPISAGEKSTATPDDEAQSTSQPQTRWYSEIYRNNNRFVLRILPKEAKICKGWNNHFCHRQRIIPHDLVLEHKERYYFPIDGDWKKKQASNKEASRFYHADPGCVQPRFPYFSKAYIEITQEVENLLSESHKSHLRNDCAVGSKHYSYKKLRTFVDWN